MFIFARNFILLNGSLSAEQKAQLMDLRHQMIGDLAAEKPYIYSQPVDMPEIPNTDFLFE